MTLRKEWVHATEGEQEVYLYTVRQEAAQTPLPTVVVIQEIFGVDDHIQDVADRFAQAGYNVIAPVLYAENGALPEVYKQERVDLIKGFLDRIPATSLHDRELLGQLLAKEPKELQETFAAVFAIAERAPLYISKLHAALAYAQTADVSAGQRIATIGYCMGGALSAQMACRSDALSGAVIYYGMLPRRELIAGVGCPVLGVFGSEDKGINALLPEFQDAMEAEGKQLTTLMYEGAHHGFFNDTRNFYNVDAARDAWVQTLTFMREVLA